MKAALFLAAIILAHGAVVEGARTGAVGAPPSSPAERLPVARDLYPRPSADAPSPPTCFRPATCQKLREAGRIPPECRGC